MFSFIKPLKEILEGNIYILIYRFPKLLSLTPKQVKFKEEWILICFWQSENPLKKNIYGSITKKFDIKLQWKGHFFQGLLHGRVCTVLV